MPCASRAEQGCMCQLRSLMALRPMEDTSCWAEGGRDVQEHCEYNSTMSNTIIIIAANVL